MKPKVLLIGADSFLGTALLQQLSKKFDVTGTSFPEKKGNFIELDLGNPKELSQALSSAEFEIVILAAAESNVDLYESNP